MIDIKLKQSSANPIDDGDIDFTGGDLDYTESTAQHQRDILLAGQGHFKEFPEAGVGSDEYINDTDPAFYLRAARIQLGNDGMRIEDIYFDTNGMLVIDGEYENNNG